MIKSFFALAGAVVVSMGLTACAHSQSGAQTSGSSALNFEQDIQPIFSAKCTSCHGASRAAEDLRLDSWEYLFDGADDGEAVIQYDPDNSLLVEITARLAGGNHPSELKGDTLTSDEMTAIRNWIENGAKNKKGAVPYTGSRNLLYACNQGDATISVIDMDANVVIRTVDLQKLGFSPNSKPHDVAVEPGGEHWYVSLIGDDVV
ncbi:MAG: c-type cytochrome domain-containing protein, partial [Rhodothermia bacterium]